MTKLKLSRFFRDERGNVAMIFGLAVMPLVIGAGAAMDYSRASDHSAALKAGTDATALILCQLPGTTTTADLNKLALNGVQSYMKSATVTLNSLQFTNSPRAVTLTTSATYNTAFMKIVNKPTMTLGATAACSAAETYFEVALALDTTGSMASSGGTQTKMEAAKSAAKSFVDYMYTTGAQPGHLKMSLVPFAASVAIPTASRTASWLDSGAVSPLHWQYVTDASGQSFTNRLSIFSKLKNSNSDWDWQGCVESPVYPYNVKDDAVSTSTPKSLILPLFAPDEVSNTKTCSYYGIYSYYCQDTDSNNSYLDDGTSSTGSCQNDSSSSTRMTQACKYKNPTNTRSSPPGPNWACTSRPLSVLGTAQTTMKSEIDALQPEGSTNVHEGFMWAWRTISPTSVYASQSSPPAAYGTANTQKVIVLMTDGTNTWNADSSTIGGSYYSAYGYFKNANGTDAASSNSRFKTGRTNLSTSADGRAAIDELLAEACTNAKAKNVIIYTIGFSVPSDPIDAQGLSLLSNCATGTDYAFVANDATGVIAAFDKIAKGIGSLRLTK